ncbi:hypothetical protein [Micromonospora radicis]|uniref:LysM peptidoglycan-binding domain-containing protein n=1 Tax=Micromonospora radicis TaxID=1894971 RepID=A0A418MYZ4_9ACTN|nr:hypothetical protein [Micromonospora radicis]RIV40216.1 hypothetical protein D2L64_04975 [Micromonospora radicis]
MKSGGLGRAPASGAAARRADGRRAARLRWATPLLLAVILAPVVPTSTAAGSGAVGVARSTVEGAVASTVAVAARSAAAPAETGKYYVVGPPVNGQREYLYNIALLTLGNGNRFREIVELNRGRVQSDGGTFTDGVELAPGWVLVLPRDADGPGVRTGDLPAAGPPTPRATPPAPTSAPPAPSTTPPAPSTPPAATTAPPAATTAPPAAQPSTAAPAGEPGIPAASPPSVSESSGLDGLGADPVRVGAAVFAVLLAIVAILVLPRRVRQMRSVTLDDGPWPPDRHHTPTPAEVEALAAAAPSGPDAPPSTGTAPAVAAGREATPAPRSAKSDPSAPSTPGTAPRPEPEPASAARAADHPVPVAVVGATAAPDAGPPAPVAPDDEPAEWELVGPRLADLRTAEHTQLRLAKPASPRVPAATPPDWPPFAGVAPVPATAPQRSAAAADGERPQAVDLPRPALPVDGDVPYVRADVRTEAGPAVVRLVGVTTGPAPAYAWLADDEPAPEAGVPLVLGRKGQWRLQVDLGRAPDVFTLVGTVAECQLLAAAYARQLRAGGIDVAVLDDALGSENVDGCRRLTALPTADQPATGPYVLIIGGMPDGTGAGIRAVAAATGCVPMVIGPVPDGRWSAQLGVEG